MLKIGEFSKMSHLTVKAIRFYEKEGILMPAATDEWTGYRLYDTSQLVDAAKIKALRQLDLTIDEIKLILSGKDEKKILSEKLALLTEEKKRVDSLLASINHLLEENIMKYHVTEKIIPKKIVYYSETVLKNYGDLMTWIPTLGEECMKLNPNIKCTNPPYEFCEYLDGEYKETNIKVRHNEAVDRFGNENEIVKFRELPEAKVISIFHKGPYDTLSEAYSFILNYAKDNGKECAGTIRECYIDGIWNKEDPAEWLTEVQLPIK